MIRMSRVVLPVLVGGILGYVIFKEIGMIFGIIAGYFLGRRFMI